MSSQSNKWHQRIKQLFPYSWIFIALMLVLTLISAPRAIHLISTVSTDLAELLPDDYPSVKLGKQIKDKFKGKSSLAVVLESPDPVANKKAVEALAGYLSKLPEVEKVDYTKQGFDFFDKHKLLYLDLEDLYTIKGRIKKKIDQEKLGGLYIDFEAQEKEDEFNFEDISDKYDTESIRGLQNRYITNKDETVFILWVKPQSTDASLSFFGKFFHFIESKISEFPLNQFDSQIKISYAGAIKTRLDEYNTLIQDLTRAGIISITGILLLLILFFRRPTGVVLIFLPLISGITVSFAICSLFLNHLNIVTSFLFSILSGLGVEIGIHMFARYVEDREAGIQKDQALLNIIFKTGRAAITGVLLNCVTFFILLINDFRGFSEFGIIAGIGLLVVLTHYLLFLPPLLYVSEKLKLLRYHKKKLEILNKLLRRWPVFPNAKKVALTGLVFFFVFAALLPFVRFEWNYSLLRIRIPETQHAREKLREVTKRVNSAAAVLIHNQEEAEALNTEYKKRKELDQDSPTIESFNSYYDLYPKDQPEKFKVLKEIDQLLADDALNVIKGKDREDLNEFRKAIQTTEPVQSLEEVPPEIERAFFGDEPKDNEQLAFVSPLSHLELDDGRNATAFYHDAHQVNVLGKTFYAVSDSIIFADVLQTMFRDSRKTILLSVIAILFIIYLDFRSVRRSLLAFGSVFWGVVGMGALMVLLGIKFNFYNMIIIPLVLGMAVDNSVHLIHRYDEFGEKSVMKALFTSGAAAGLSSLTNMLGYSGLIFAHHPGLSSIGMLAMLGMFTCMIGSLVFLPAALQYFEKIKR